MQLRFVRALMFAGAVVAVCGGAPRLDMAVADEEKAVLGTVEYSHGDPSGEEQMHLELLNRARMNPAAEGLRIFNDYGSPRITQLVDFYESTTSLTWTRIENRDTWATYVAEPPLAMNRELLKVAREWSQTMIDKNSAGQTFSDRLPLLNRTAEAGHCSAIQTQLINGFADDSLTAHAAWAIDWGQAIDPLTGRPRLPNRVALTNYIQQSWLENIEVGIGYVRQVPVPPGGLGPLSVTGIMTVPCDADTRYAVGVCYDDENENGEYDVGEGLPGIRIDVEESAFFAMTTASGGYAVPIRRSDGSVTITARGVAGSESANFPELTATRDTFEFDPAGGNVKADFLLPPPPPPPDAVVVEGDTGLVSTTTSASFALDFPAIAGARSDLASIDVFVDIEHVDRRHLELKLVAPSGAEVVLWNGGTPGLDLIGTFDDTIRPAEPLSALVGEAYEGRWTLDVTDSGGGTVDVRKWSLAIRPGWHRPLESQRTHLYVDKIKLKDGRKPARDSVLLKCDLETGGRLPLSSTSNLRIALIDLADESEWLVSNLVSGTVHIDGVGQGFAQAKWKFTSGRKDTSRGRLKATLKGIELVDIPAELRVELRAGDAVLAQEVNIWKNAFNGKRGLPLQPALRIEKVKSKVNIGGRFTTIKGRFKQRHLDPLPQTLEVRVNDAIGIYDEKPDVHGPTRIVFPRQKRVASMVIDPVTGSFTLKLDGPHNPMQDGVLRLRMWFGEFYGEAAVVPAVRGTRLVY